MNKLLVVCEGNICRSPMAQGLLRSRLAGWRVDSAGLNAVIGAPADPIAISLLRDRGIDIEAHRATQITRKMCLGCDMVLVMDRDQRRRLEELYPEACGRVFRVAEFAEADVPDPYRQPEKAFRHALMIIDEGVARWVHRIQRL